MTGSWGDTSEVTIPYYIYYILLYILYMAQEVIYDSLKFLGRVCTVEPVYIEHSWEMKKCSMYTGVQCI